MLPDFNRLKVFYFVFYHRSVALAAKQLHVTQSAVSQSLNKLEEELCQTLFTRVHKRLVPTAEGQMLFKVTEPFINQLREQLDRMRFSHSVPAGVLRIGAPVEFGETYLIPACAQFRKTFPQVSFQLELGHPDALLPSISRGDLDLALADIFAQNKGYAGKTALFDIRTIFTEELVLVCSRQYHNRRLQDGYSYERLISCSFVAYQSHFPAIRDWFRYHFKKTTVPVKTALTVESVRGVISGIKQHLGLGIVPSHLVRNEIDRGEINVIRVSEGELINRISLVRLLDKVPNLTEKEFTRYFRTFIDAHFTDSRGESVRIAEDSDVDRDVKK